MNPFKEIVFHCQNVCKLHLCLINSDLLNHELTPLSISIQHNYYLLPPVASIPILGGRSLRPVKNRGGEFW